MKKTLIIFIFIISVLLCFGQEKGPTIYSQSNYSFDFKTFLSGVKDAEILVTPEQEEYMNNNLSSSEVYLGVAKYLESMGFETVGFSSKFRNKNYPSLCQKTTVSIKYSVSTIYSNGYYINGFTLTFYSCNGDSWTFQRKSEIIVNGWGSLTDKTVSACRLFFAYTKPIYNNSNSIKLKTDVEKTSWTEEKLKTHFQTNGADVFEGIYENTDHTVAMAKYKVGVLKNNTGYDIIYLSGASNYLDWSEGDIKAKLSSTATNTMYKSEWSMADKTINSDMYVSFEVGLMNVYAPDKSKQLYLKLFPSSSDNVSVSNNLPASGTGFSISSDGLIVTNHHVVNGATKIKVRGINGDFSKSYNARKIIEDKNNDLAIIQIDDASFTSIGNVPFIINAKSTDVGTSIFVLGYPLRATMGDEIKLTNGIISSKSGFQGDVTTYQMTAPVQPGSSGGPMFDDKGNLIGVVNAKHLDAENVSYAIKSSYLLNLIDLMPSIPNMETVSTLNSNSLSEQVKILKKYVYIIEINQ